jgi:hypothetical protein
MGNGKWEMGNGKWEMGNGKWEMGNGRVYKKKMPRQAGHFQEDGDDILSRMLLQYHLRKWA